MAKSWIVDCRGIAKKVRNATLSSEVQIKDCGAKRECPNCHYWIDNSDVSQEWPGLPIGVKFDPSDAELLEHLVAKCGIGDSRPHMFIDEFIPTLEGDRGICYTHPKNLPGSSKDGTSVHFFYKTTNAYASGQRKRRKILTEHDEEDMRWHKTGKTKHIVDNGVHKGCKKIMVLYKSSQKGSKPVKSNWVMHQYHLGAEDDEREGEFVVSKIFYQQQKQNDKNVECVEAEESKPVVVPCGPKTPMTQTPYPPRAESSLLHDDVDDDITFSSIIENPESREGFLFPPSCSQYMANVKPLPELRGHESHTEELSREVLAGESQAQGPDPADLEYNSLLCKEIFSPGEPLGDGIANINDGGYNGSFSRNDLDSIRVDSPDFQLTDLYFGSQESLFDWLDNI